MNTVAVSLFAGIASGALAAPPHALQQVAGGTRIEPVRIASARIVNGQAVRTSEWIEYHAGASRGSPLYAFDCYDGDASGVPTSGTCTNVSNGSRWYFGSGYINPNTIEDMTNAAGFGGALVDGINNAFYVNVAETSHCFVAYFFYEEMIRASDCSVGDLDDFTPTGEGIIIDYGKPPIVWPYYSNIENLIAHGITLRLPSGTEGSYQMMILGDADGNGEPDLDPSDHCQPMLWGTADAGGTPGRVGTQHALSLDDDGGAAGGPDGEFEEDECYDYAAGFCPDPLGKCNGFLLFDGCTGNADYNGNGFIEGSDFDQFVLDFEAGCTGASDPCPTGCNCGGDITGDPCLCTGTADYNGNGFIEGSDFDLFVTDYGNGCR